MSAIGGCFLFVDPKPLPNAKLNFRPSLSLSLNFTSHGNLGRRRVRDFTLQAAVSGQTSGGYDPELRMVLDLATDTELHEIKTILFGPSYFSPLLKSLTNRDVVEDDYEGREVFIEHLESRFLFLAADARSTLRGWRPSYRDVLLSVRKKLCIQCSNKLSTEDLEAEIFLHLLQEYSSEAKGSVPFIAENFTSSDTPDSLEFGLDQWKTGALAALKAGAGELRSMLFKGGGMLTLAKIYQLLAKRLSGKMLLEAANYQIRREVLKKGGQLAAINLESRAALLAARQGFGYATSRYLGLRSMMTLFGPMLWGMFLADVAIQMIGTDYARILRAIYAFAQIRLTRTYGWTSVKEHPTDCI